MELFFKANHAKENQHGAILDLNLPEWEFPLWS